MVPVSSIAVDAHCFWREVLDGGVLAEDLTSERYTAA
jgi:hypothetical protein